MEKLNSTAIEQLISRYNQELEKLRFQTVKTQGTINELKEGLRVAKEKEASVLQEMRENQQQASEEAVEKIQSNGSGKSAADAKTKATTRKKRTKAKAKVGRPRKKTKTKAKKKAANESNDRSRGYRLSPVDELVLEALAARTIPLKTAELHEYAAAHMEEKGESYDDERLRLLISRSLQKLANRRDDVVKLRNPNERGHLYALPNWLSGSGEEKKLKKKFERK
jgi:hypothetical protein